MEFAPVKYAALSLTHNCNLRCRYCYAGTKTGEAMTSATARQAVDFLAAHANGNCTVTLFGGEPLMEFDLIKETVAYSRERHDRRLAFRMSTNGTLLSPEVFTFLRENDIYFALSIDGSAEQHNCNRVYVGNRGSYGDIAVKIEQTLQYNPYTVAVSVVTPDTVEHLAGGVEHLFDLGFRYVLQTLNYSAPWQSNHVSALKRQYRKIASFYYDSLRDGRKIYYSPFDERIKTWAQKPYGKGDLCDLANSQLAIAPSGRLYPCVQFVGDDDTTAQQNAIGDVWNGFDPARRAWFVEQNHLDTESCTGCALYGRCATYCGCVNWHTTGQLNRIPPIICEHERMLMPIVDQLANRLWKKNVDLFKRKFYEKSFPVSSYIEDCLIRKTG